PAGEEDWERLNWMLLEDAFALELVKRADEQWIKRKSKLLVSKCNALVFPDASNMPKDAGVDEAELITGQLGPGLKNSFKMVRADEKPTVTDAYANRLVVNDILVKMSELPPGASHRAETAFDQAPSCARDISLLNYKRR